MGVTPSQPKNNLNPASYAANKLEPIIDVEEEQRLVITTYLAEMAKIKFEKEQRQLRAIFHAIGPTNLKSKDLNGMTFRESANQLQYYLEKFIYDQLRLQFLDDHADTITETQKQKLLNIKNTLNQAYQLQQEVDEKSEEFLKNFKQKIESNNRFLFFGGYVVKQNGGNQGKGHGIVFEVIKEKNGTYTFIVNNTGRGAEKHRSKGFRDHRAYTMVYKGLKLDDFDLNFWDKLLLIKSHDNKIDEDALINTIYKHIDNKLKRKTGIFKSNKTKGRVLKLQRAGVCAWKSLSTWLHGSIAPGQNPSDRKKEDELLYLKFMKFLLEQKMKELCELSISYDNKSITIFKTSKLFHVSFKKKPKDFNNQALLNLLKDELKNKINRIDKKISFINKNTLSKTMIAT